MFASVRAAAGCAALLLVLIASGCTSRGMTVTSNPPGAELSINRRVVGKTPMRVGFTHYGTYRYELRLKGYEVLVKEENIKPGFYGYDPAAFVADNIIPARLNDEVYIHYNLKKIATDEAAEVGEEKAEKTENSEEGVEAENDGDTPEPRLGNRTALMARANAARSGRVVHPKSGDEVAIDLGREEKELVSAAPEEEMVEAKPAAPAAIIDNEPRRDISGKRPEGLRIAGEYGIGGEEEKRGSFEKPEAKRAATPKEVRTPAEEELVYDQPAIVDPNAKPAKPKAEEKPAEKKPAPAAAPAKKSETDVKAAGEKKPAETKTSK